MRCYREIAAEEINFIYVLEVFFAVFPSAPNTPILFLRYYLRPEYTDCFCISQEVSGELLPSRFGVHTKNVSSALRSGEITNAAVPVFGKAETPPALWRRGAQPGG